jgi:hypothetical protein
LLAPIHPGATQDCRPLFHNRPEIA